MEKFTITNLSQCRLGFGCLQLKTVNQSMDLIRGSYRLGIRLFDTAAMYGTYTGENEELLGESILQLSHEFKDENFRQKIFIATKGGVSYQNGKLEICGSATSLKRNIENSLRRLKSSYIDVFYLHRVDPKVNIIESIAAIAEYVIQGKIRYIGLSEVTTEIIQTAEQVHPVHFIQNEFSPWYRDNEKIKNSKNIFSYCAANNKIYVAYSPLARGFFTNTNQKFFENLPKNDFRRKIPRYCTPFLNHNLSKRSKLEEISNSRKIPLSALTLAWIIDKGKQMGLTLIPIPASANLTELEENIRALAIQLSDDERNEFNLACIDGQYIGSHLPAI